VLAKPEFLAIRTYERNQISAGPGASRPGRATIPNVEDDQPRLAPHFTVSLPRRCSRDHRKNPGLGTHRERHHDRWFLRNQAR
jgi:hypothetical protein